jgi:hypothetical protein
MEGMAIGQKNNLKIFLLETTWPISTKLCLNDP